MSAKRQVTTKCPMNCLPTQCGMTVEVEENRLLSLKGDKHNPDSQGFLCIRGRATREIFENPKRLLHPLRRVGERGENRWERCSWDEAYTLIVDSIQQTQPERVGLWRGHSIGTTGPTGTTLVNRFALLGGFQQWSGAPNACQSQPGAAALDSSPGCATTKHRERYPYCYSQPAWPIRGQSARDG